MEPWQFINFFRYTSIDWSMDYKYIHKLMFFNSVVGETFDILAVARMLK